MKHRTSKSGMTLVEVMVSVFLVAVAAAIVYTEMIVSYRILMRSRAKLEAQSMAFDTIWATYNMSWDELMNDHSVYIEPEDKAVSPGSMIAPDGIIRTYIIPENDSPTAPDLINYWDIIVEIWPGENSPLQVGTKPLATYRLQRKKGPR